MDVYDIWTKILRITISWYDIAFKKSTPNSTSLTHNAEMEEKVNLSHLFFSLPRKANVWAASGTTTWTL